ncbi:carboxypeptidase B-like [Branchiostoma floridae]|uniref:Carboxypeptidase B-like n=1 Tax=Branchiostoma floridae TaxID=7739 RepID=A0A9J7LME4_BRAFL|nr:carboxypeptidase B-like [Branchiostoma floridae]
MAPLNVLLCLSVFVSGCLTFSCGQRVLDEDLDSAYRGILKIRTQLGNTTLAALAQFILPKISDPTQILEAVAISGTKDALATIKPSIEDEFKALLREYGVSYEVYTDDYREMIEKHLRENLRLVEDDKVGEFNFARYHPYDEILQYLKDTAEKYPNLATVVNVAHTFEGRRIVAMKIGVAKDTPKRAVWIDAGIHAREWIAPATTLYFIQQLVTRYGHDQTVTDLLEKLDWYILPVMNVDGYIYSWSHPARRLWRKSTAFYNSMCEDRNSDTTSSCTCTEDDLDRNCTCPDTTTVQNCTCLGVDLNRNWDAEWGGPGASPDPCSDIYHGRSPVSEPEVKGVSEFILQRRGAIQAYLSLHSYGQLWMYPYGYNATKTPTDIKEHVKLSEIATAAIRRVNGKQYRHGRATDVLFEAAGCSDDWAYDKAGIVHSYTIELRDTWEYGFLLPPDQILPTAQEVFPAFIQVRVQP